MTLSPSEDRRSEGLDGPHYPLNQICFVPGCMDRKTLQRHHFWRKSDVIGDKWWVKLSDGEIRGNCGRVCAHHHRDLTDNIAHVAYHEGQFWWKDIISEPLLLDWQPPGEAVYEELREPAKPSGKDDDLALAEKLGAAHALLPSHDPDICPTCLRKLPRPKEERSPEAPKLRKTWSVAVPMDHWEDGAEVIDTLLREAHTELNRRGLPYGEGKTVRYYILTAALALFVTHAEELMSDE